MSELTPIDPTKGATTASDAEEFCEPGQWYWVKSRYYDTDAKKYLPYEWLGCVQEIGSNYVGLHGIKQGSGGGYSTARVHFDEFWTELRFEPDAEAVIAEKTAGYRATMDRLIGEIKDVTARLGVAPMTTIEDRSGVGENSLAIVAQQVDTTAYKNALVEAKEKILPELHKEIKEAAANYANWLAAPTMPMLAAVTPMKKTVGRIEDRIYTLGLYAGLSEDAIKCCDGDPAAHGEKLRVMQRRLYMDEECLLDYTAGGIDFNDIHQFDAWISRPENRDRLLPFPRTLAGFRVRRNEKERENGGHAWRAFVNVQLKDADKFTFFYVRNGEQVWRIVAEFEFGEMIFPNKDVFDPGRPMMVKMFANRVDKMITLDEYEVRKAEYDAKKKVADDWEAANPDVKNKSFHNPHNYYSWQPHEWKPMDFTNVYYDEALAEIESEMKRYNRVAVIIQGLFDRSLVLHPHPPVSVWTNEGFEAAIELIYDAMTLTHGDAPDFEAYRAELNASLSVDSIVTGQESYWMLVEAVKENKRQEADRNRDRVRSHYTRYRPDGNPGPGLIAKMDDWKPRVRKAVFHWTRESQGWRSYRNPLPATLTVPASALFNVSAYRPGDFKRFFADPRTRADYLKWAPLMLAAEDYHAGKIGLRDESKIRSDREWH